MMTAVEDGLTLMAGIIGMLSGVLMGFAIVFVVELFR
jgi:hypothetical protein